MLTLKLFTWACAGQSFYRLHGTLASVDSKATKLHEAAQRASLGRLRLLKSVKISGKGWKPLAKGGQDEI
ncbi:hypothetical protein CIB48_g540 [Xylaria polymorpha]|nr:hypothetical protein CIB48_g540 [Xylaria polymorpha]